jgi:hypothetical protein
MGASSVVGSFAASAAWASAARLSAWSLLRIWASLAVVTFWGVTVAAADSFGRFAAGVFSPVAGLWEFIACVDTYFFGG